MIEKNISLKVQNNHRYIRLRLCCPNNSLNDQRQLIIIATGLYSHMDKESQIKLAESYQKAGFSTLQFNFMGHGGGHNKSDGKLKDITLSSSLEDLKAVWDYSQELSGKVNINNTVITANSYGALISLMALERKFISPESMILVAPYSFDKFKPWVLPIKLISKLLPEKTTNLLRLPVSSTMVKDFLKYHTHAVAKKDLLGSTAVHFFVGSDDKISSQKNIKKWCKVFNKQTPSNIPFIDNKQAHYTVYEGVSHFDIPQSVQQDINQKAISFITKTKKIRSHDL
ncbi:MAG: alpha/beta hydrolase [Alphaproteobacteria bacterium]|nr:alpha/beta hydrolase [Alphaproteobacteria bacterium]